MHVTSNRVGSVFEDWIARINALYRTRILPGTRPSNDLACRRYSSHALATVERHQDSTVSGDDMQVAAHGYGGESEWV